MAVTVTPAGGAVSMADFARIRQHHPLVDVLGRLGVQPPACWDGHADFKISCPCPGHRDSTPSCVIHPDTDRWHCFGCSTGGDVLDLIRAVTGASLTAAAGILDGGARITPIAAHPTPSTNATAVSVPSVERPDPARTPLQRVLAVNAAAWTYYTQPRHAATARAYLRGRGIDVTALEREAGAPLAGYAPGSSTGLTEHLTQQGFTGHELVDAGWASRHPDAGLHDRYRRRALLPVHGAHHQVLGVYARDVTGRATSKYLNTGHTVAFQKGAVLYRPTTPVLDRHATVIVCEGSLDALAIAAHAGTGGRTRYFAPVSPSGTALTDQHVRMILALHPAPPLICADGDPPGRVAALTWIERITRAGRESVATPLPGNHDPASWLREHGTAGLCAFIRKGCLDTTGDDLRPVHSAALLANTFIDSSLSTNTNARAAVPDVVGHLGRVGAMIPGDSASHRFATAAGHALAQWEVGTEAALSRLVLAAIRDARSDDAVTMTAPPVGRLDGPVHGAMHH